MFITINLFKILSLVRSESLASDERNSRELEAAINISCLRHEARSACLKKSDRVVHRDAWLAGAAPTVQPSGSLQTPNRHSHRP